MAFENLASFISQLEDDGDIVRVSAEVDPVFEIAEITDRACKTSGGGPALFFERVKGHSIPVVTNLLGSYERMCKALGASFDEIAARIAGVIQPDLPEGWLDSLRLVPRLAELGRIPPRTVKTGACQQVVNMGRDVDLGRLPIPHCWPGEADPTITAGHLHTRDPETGAREVGLCSLQVRDRDSLFVHWTKHQKAWRIYSAYRTLSRPMPVAVALGGDPLLAYVAGTPLPAETDACVFAGFLRGDAVELVKCRSIDLDVPSDAEIVIEGSIDTSAPLESAGPIACPTGFYTLSAELPTLNLTALTHRSNPMFPAKVVGRPPMEDFWPAKATERIFLPFLKLFVADVVDVHLPRSGVFRNLMFVSIRKRYPQQARQVMHALWGLPALMTIKMIVVVDAAVDVTDEEAIWFHVGANAHPGRDVVFCEGPTHFEDHAAPVAGMGHKMGIDATRKLPEEGHPRPWPQQLAMSADVKALVDGRWGEYGFHRPVEENVSP